MDRFGDRKVDELRPISFELNYTKWAEGSVLVCFGDTKVLCNVSVDERVPRWLHQSQKGHGWLSAEYALLPRSTDVRHAREQRWPRGRTQEISRLIGRSLRMSLNLRRLGTRQLLVDCDVIQADGGTRTAAITGSWVAVNLALQKLIAKGLVSKKVFRHQIAAVSVGLVNGQPVLDLDYGEDSSADADFNVVMTAEGGIVEIQGTGEEKPIPYDKLNPLIELAIKGMEDIFLQQQLAILEVTEFSI